MGNFRKYALLILASFLLISCATPITQPVKVNDALVAIEAQRQRELVLKNNIALQKRLDGISYPILKAALPFCPDYTRPFMGTTFANKYSYSGEYRDAAISAFGMNEILTVTHVTPGAPADRAGILPGDKLTTIENITVPVGMNAATELFQIIKSNLTTGGKGKLTILRKGEKIDFVFFPDSICQMPIHCGFNSNELNAYADGTSVFITKGIMRFADTDQELALIVSHEVAHNIMGHIEAKKQNQAVGSIFDILAAIYGVNTHGAFGNIGAEQYSQEFEYEADAIGVYLMARAGYELDNTVMFWRKYGAENPSAIGLDPSSSHPSTPERFAAIEKHIEIIKNKEKAGLPLLPDIKKAEVEDAVASKTAIDKSNSSPNTILSKTTPKIAINEANNWIDKSYSSLASKDWIEAIRTSTVAIRLNPYNPKGYINRSWAYIEKELYEKALSDCGKALELDNTNSMALNNRGLIYLRTGNEDQAVKDFGPACKSGLEVSCQNYKAILGYLPSEKIEIMQKRTTTHFNSGNYEKSIELATEIIEEDHLNEIAYSNRCAAFASKNLLENAKSDCTEALRINPDYAMAYNNLGYVLEREGKIEDATINYEISCNLNLDLGCENLKRLKTGDQH